MKVEFKTSKGEFSFVKCPDNTHDNDYTWSTEEDISFVLDEELKENPIKDIHVGKCSIIGFVKDLTEKQWAEVVDNIFNLHYKNYDGKDYSKQYGKEYHFNTATESGKSLMDSLEVYLENPVPQPEIYYDPEISMDSIHNGFYDQSWVDTYQEAEERTGNWLLIKYL